MKVKPIISPSHIQKTYHNLEHNNPILAKQALSQIQMGFSVATDTSPSQSRTSTISPDFKSSSCSSLEKKIIPKRSKESIPCISPLQMHMINQENEVDYFNQSPEMFRSEIGLGFSPPYSYTQREPDSGMKLKTEILQY